MLTITDVRVHLGDGGFLINDGTTAVLYDSSFGFNGKKLAENIENIFNPFFTTKESGTGLGLYIVGTELEKVQGTISVTSREEIETVFTVLIPTEMEGM